MSHNRNILTLCPAPVSAGAEAMAMCMESSMPSAPVFANPHVVGGTTFLLANPSVRDWFVDMVLSGNDLVRPGWDTENGIDLVAANAAYHGAQFFTVEHDEDGNPLPIVLPTDRLSVFIDASWSQVRALVGLQPILQQD